MVCVCGGGGEGGLKDFVKTNLNDQNRKKMYGKQDLNQPKIGQTTNKFARESVFPHQLSQNLILVTTS